VPELSVVVPSHFRPVRLRWLLNALAEQTLDRSRWEVIVGHDGGSDTERVVREHPLAQAAVLRSTQQPTGTAPPGRNRNAALALARAPLVVFTDDDCRPPPEWLERVLDAARHHPGAVIQGSVISDPEEAAMLRSPYPRTQQYLDVPRVWGECANIVYPRELLERLGGFEQEDWQSGEDTDLLLRARAAGAEYVGDTGMQTRHAVEEGWLLGQLRGASRCRDTPALVARHPELREHFLARVFWKKTHAWLLLGALAATTAAARRPPGSAALAIAAAVPYAAARPWRGGGPRGRLRHLAELPGWALVDLAELLVLARASAGARTVVL
jgi:hypothetical protein